MRKLLTTQAVLALTLLAACADRIDSPTSLGDDSTLEDQAARAQALGYVPGQILVRFRSGAPIDELVQREGAEIEQELDRGTRLLGVPAGREQDIADELALNPLVEFAEPDYIYTIDVPCETGDCVVPTDDFFGYRWDLHNDGTITNSLGVDLASTGALDADMDWLEAFDAIGAISGSAIVGIMDTGILATHEDLAGKYVAGFDFFDNDPDPADDNGHGTHVAGIVAGSGNNGTGVPGIGWVPEVQVVSAKVCGLILGFFYGCPSSAIAAGITWAVDNGANVLNLSLGGGTGSAEVQSALQYARANNVLPICAAGNDSGAVSFPGAFPECAAVSATDWSDGLASYSNFGPEVEIAAAGGDFENANGYSQILSSYRDSNTSYAWLAGTSMASPQAAGLAGLLHALGETDDDDKLARMRTTADDLGAPGDDVQFGAGRINVFSAVADLVGASTNRIPTAEFSVVCPDLACDFTDQSTDLDGTVVSWLWDFGDGNGSALQDPSNTYGAAGTYTVTLNATDDEGAVGSISTDVTVPTPNQAPTASFSSSCTALDCSFTDASSDSDGSVVDWQWDFGDGNGSSTEQNPSYSYGAGGTYSVTLTATDDDGAAGVLSTDVTVEGPNQPPTASFTSSCTDLTCVFTDTSADPDGTIDIYQWTFGDGVSTNAQSPTYTYGVAGTYTVTLSIFDDDGANGTSSADVTVTGPNQAPAASFTYTCNDLSCDFADASTDPDGTIASWQWDFGDGNGSSEQSPSYTFGADDTYTVTLVATDDDGAEGNFSTDVTVPAPNQAPTASFTSTCTVFDCLFTDSSTDPDGTVVSWAWDFGDGSVSSEQSPGYSYGASGTYLVSLTATDDQGGMGTFSADVTVEGPNQPPTASFTYACTDLTCVFTNTSSDPDGTVTINQWAFGDGVSTNAVSPTYTYGAGGTYTVTLSIFDDDGAGATSTTDVTVAGPNQAPAASFTYTCNDLSCDFADASTDPDGTIASWQWDFGDGNGSSEQSPSYAFGADGTYTVTLVATDDDGAEGNFSTDVTVPAPNQAPTASFTSTCTVFDCLFTDSSTDPDGTVVSWEWDFGDGSVSSEQSPGYSYGASGTYLVSLTATDDQGGMGTFSADVTVEGPNQPPTASFTYACTDLTCVFTNTSSDPDGTVTINQWAFGDGVSSNGVSPTYTYGAGGTYSVTLSIFDDDGAGATSTTDVTVTAPNQAPAASFTSSCADLSCDFTDASTDPDGTVASWQWDFGDGGSSSEQSPSYSYTETGTYIVTVTATDDDGASGSFSADVTVLEPNLAPTAGFTSSCTLLDCVFTDVSADPDGLVTTWLWDFGDGNGSTEQSPSYSYTAEDTYSVSLTVTDDVGASDTFSADVTVSVPNQAPTASFTYACTDLTCVFTNTSNDPDGTVTINQWAFGDGVSSNGVSPTYTYGAGGTYSVTLSIFDNDGAGAASTTDVTVTAPNQAPAASFTSSCADLSCDFTDASTDPDGTVASWQWDFGDGGSSSEQSPSYSYTETGTYTVTVTATDDDGASGSFSADVTVLEPNLAPTAGFTSSCTLLDCVFTDVSADPDGLVTTWLWDFGDGNGSTEQSPSYSYTAEGTYSVSLTVTDDVGASDTFSADVTVSVPNQAPTASFTYACTDLTCVFTNTSNDPDGTVTINQWAFGDGVSSNGVSPTYTYGAGGTYSVTLSIFDNDGAGATSTTVITVTAPTAGTIGEVGSVSVTQSDATQWLSVAVTGTYSDPIVVMGPISFGGSDPATIRVRNVTSAGFEFQIDEWDYLDGSHVTETVSYIVMEAGVQQLANGTRIEAGRRAVGTGWSTVSLTSFSGAPVVLSQAASTNEASAITTRQRQVTASSFQIQIEEEEAGGSHGSEDVHWIAVERTTVSGEMEAGATPDQVRHTWYTVPFAQSYAAPVFLGAMQTTDGGDSASLRYRNLTSGNAQVHVDEEQSANTETNHTREIVGFLVFEGTGPLQGS